MHSPTPAPAGNRPNPQTGALGLLNIMGVLVLTGGRVDCDYQVAWTSEEG
ncbi:MAG: hypothetical protein FWC73_13345 [Defluviitaleaceae bacterium]|nr:hypothetical protein [Defluviitaleaceae bacterium]